MIYIYRTYRLVKVVADEMTESTHPLDSGRDVPLLHHCLTVFQSLNRRYTPQEARKILAIATGENYLSIKAGSGHPPGQRLQIMADGVILLRPTGLIIAMAKSVDASLIISILALLVSILVALSKC